MTTLSRIRRTVFAIGISISVSSIVYGQTALQPKSRIGVFGGIGLNDHSGNFTQLPGVLNCNSTFGSGSGFAPVLGVSYQYPLDNSLMLGLAATYSGLGGDHVSNEYTVTSIDGRAVPVSIAHTLATQLRVLTATPFVAYNLFGNFTIRAGAGLGWLYSTHFDQQERVAAPSEVVFDNGSKSRNHQEGVVPLANTLIASLDFGIGYRLPLNTANTLHAVPQVEYRIGLVPVVKDLSWYVNQFAAGIGVEYTFPQEQPETPAPIAPPPPEVPIPPLPTLALDVRGLSRSGNEESVARFTVEELWGRTLAPLLPYIFFDSTSVEFPQRMQFSSAPVNFDINKAVSANAVETYRNTLDIIGQRIAAQNDITVVLTGIATNESMTSIAQTRAETIRSYFEKTWGIQPDRITLRTQVSANPRIADKDVRNEENCVEIAASDLSVFDPVEAHDTVRTVNPPGLRMYPLVTSNAGLLRDWTVSCIQSDKTLTSFSGLSLPTQHIDWNIGANEMPKYPGDLEVRFTATDTLGRKVTVSASIPVEQQTLSKKRTVRTTQGEVERYSLITFDFASAALTPQHLKLLERIKNSVKSNSKVTITGYTDRIDESGVNHSLSERRAAAVAKALGVGQVEVRGVGNGELLYSNDLPEGRMFSRTVVITVVTDTPSE